MEGWCQREDKAQPRACVDASPELKIANKFKKLPEPRSQDTPQAELSRLCLPASPLRASEG